MIIIIIIIIIIKTQFLLQNWMELHLSSPRELKKNKILLTLNYTYLSLMFLLFL